jgi:hypothetical protein
MALCFIYGGISLLFFILQLMSLNGFPPMGPPSFAERILENRSPDRIGPLMNFTNSTNDRIFQVQSRASEYFYFVIVISLLGSMTSIVAGLAIHSLMRKRDRREMTKSVIDIVTTPEEKMVLKELEENGGQMTQTELAKRTKLTKVKIHRVVKRLESIGVVSKYDYGMTNKIKLEKKIFEE